MADTTDKAIEVLLRETLHGEAASLPLRVRPQDIEDRAVQRRRQRTRHRLGLPLLVAAGLLVPLGLAWAIGSSSVPEDGRGYEAVLVRGLDRSEDGGTTDDLDVVLADADGSVQTIRRVPAAQIPAQEGVAYPALSAQGWLTFSTEVGDGLDPTDVLLDLGDPARVPTLLPGWSATGWGTDGSLWRATGGRIEHIDPETGSTSTTPVEALGGLDATPFESWELPTVGDGLVLWAFPETLGQEAGTLPRIESWGALGADGGLDTGGIPHFTENGRLRFFSPQWGMLWICDTDPQALSYCPGRPRGSILSGPGHDRDRRTWRGRPAPDDYVVGASWAADGGVWLLIDRRSNGRTFVLTHLALDGTEREVASFVADPEGSVSIDGLAPDDSRIAIGWVDESGWQTVLIDTRSGRAALHRGALAGFASTDQARTWVQDDGAPEQGAPLAKSPATGIIPAGYPALPPLAVQTQGMEQTLLVHEELVHSASSEETPPPVVLGPIDLDVGYGISLVCSGPGDVWYRVNDDPDAVLKHCQDGVPDDWAALLAEEDITIRVTADPSTAWRIVVYDPPPWLPRRSPGPSADG